MSSGVSASVATTQRRPLFSWNSSFPLPEAELEAAFAQHTNAREFLWVQEEPANMGALNFLAPQLERLARRETVPLSKAFSVIQSVHGFAHGA